MQISSMLGLVPVGGLPWLVMRRVEVTTFGVLETPRCQIARGTFSKSAGRRQPSSSRPWAITKGHKHSLLQGARVK